MRTKRFDNENLLLQSLIGKPLEQAKELTGFNGFAIRVTDLEFDLDFTQAAIDNIVKNGFDPQYGARPLKRAIQKYVEDVLTEEIISNNPEKGSKLVLDYNQEEDKMFVTVSKKKKKKDEKKDDNKGE